MRKNKRQPKVLVTGAAGFIGSALTKLLLGQGAQVTALDDLSFGRKEHLWPGIRFVRGDIRSRKALLRAVDRTYDAVYHLAAIHFIPYCNEHPRETLSINVEGTRQLLEVLEEKQPKRFFLASTAAVYAPTDLYHSENDLPKPMDIYGISKLSAEHLAMKFHHETNVPCAIGRLFNAYGPRETNAHLIPHIMSQLKKGKKIVLLGNLAPFRDYIHTSDMANAITSLTTRTKQGISLANVASGKEYSVRQVLSVFSKALGKNLQAKSHFTLKRKAERMHLRPDLRALRRIARFTPKVTFPNGIRDLLLEEGILRR